MAKVICDFCGSEIKESISQSASLDAMKVTFCPACWSQYEVFKFAEVKRPDALQYFGELIRTGSATQLGTRFFKERLEKKYLEDNDPDRPKPVPVPDDYTQLSNHFILSTANTLEGYRITKQLGIVFGETVFKPSAGQQLASSVGDAFRALSFSAKEMTGQVQIIEEARKFAYMKMMKAAYSRGANAIIAIDSDNTIGDSICYLSLYGTAVYAEPISDDSNRKGQEPQAEQE